MNRLTFLSRLGFICLAMTFLFFGIRVAAQSSQFSDENLLSLKFQLIWGTNMDLTGKKVKFKEVDDEVKRRLGEFLKWNAYYEISCQRIQLKDSNEQTVKMSKKCEIKVNRIGPNVIEAILFGEGKLLLKKKAKITKNKPHSLAGKNEANADFWCVFISLDDTSSETDSSKK